MDNKGALGDYHTIVVMDNRLEETRKKFDAEVNKWRANGYSPEGGSCITKMVFADKPAEQIVFSIGMLKPAVPPTVNLLDLDDLQPGAPHK